MKSIMVVDDSPTNLKFVESVLKDEFKLTMVKSGEKALQYLSKNPVDLVLLDILMPEMDGYQTYEGIKQLELNHDVPVVFLTADVEVDNEIKGLEMGAVDFIRKPFVPEVMLNRIRRILRMEDLNNSLEELNKSLERRVKEKTNQVEQLSFEIISTIASMIEAKDSYTKGHSVRVAEYSALLAGKLGWKEEDIQNLRYIALLHDIGKVGIPDNVLNKPTKLTEEEFSIIKSHTTIGGDILKDIESIMYVDSGAKYHHERYDGRGYPCGLVGEHIPLVARVICIADAYDAMSSKRVYRDSLPPDVIRNELAGGRGTQFDPLMLDAFLQLLDAGELKVNTQPEEKQKTILGEGSALMSQIMKSIEEEVKKVEAIDYLTGLLGRKEGERQVSEAMKESEGVLAFMDLDNLKRTNDTMGHLAGDYALKAVGEVLSEHSENAIAARMGGDEFMYYMKGVDADGATKIVEHIIQSFEGKKEGNTYLSVSSLSVGLCTTRTTDTLDSVLKKADRALYYVKQSGKCGYYFYTRLSDETSKKSSVDLDRLVSNLKLQGNYSGALSVDYREFAKIYDFVNHLGERYEYDIQLIMITLDTDNQEPLFIDERGHAMTCMEKTIQASLRTVDVCTRFSSKQFIVILTNAQSQDIEMITSRIAENFYKIYDRKLINVLFNVAELTNFKK
ncbi:MAG: diguanylate cyclase [Lachnospiraceae bacterium]|nr:diguanylate cyclase [Lachnospiraceae bacterium]